MKPKWTIKPTKITTWNKEVNYVMFVDENGNSDIKYLLKRISKNLPVDENDKYFTVTGCIFLKNDYFIAKQKINELKNKYWNNGLFKYKDKVKKVCFHSREIRRKSDAFDINLIDYNNFMNDISNLIKQLNYKIISIAINKEDYLLKHYQFNVYNTAMCFLLQQFIYVMPYNVRSSWKR